MNTSKSILKWFSFISLLVFPLYIHALDNRAPKVRKPNRSCYTVELLSQRVTVSSLNDDAISVGEIDLDGVPRGDKSSVLIDQGVVADIGAAIGGVSNGAYDINKLGAVVGFVHDNGKDKSYIYSNGVAEYVDIENSSNISLNRINNFGEAVGYFYDAKQSQYRALLIEAKDPKSYVVPEICSATEDASSSYATDINSSGLIVGICKRWQSEPRYTDAVLYDSNTSTRKVLKYLHNGRRQAQPTAINDLGQVVGYAVRTEGYSSWYQAVLWENGEVRAIGPFPGGMQSMAYDINTRGQVVGWSEVPNAYYSHGFIYHNGVIQDLNDLLCEGSNSTVWGAERITDSGKILAVLETEEGIFQAILKPKVIRY